MDTNIHNPLLAQAEQQLEAKIPPNWRSDYLKIVIAGMKVALQNGPNGAIGQLRGQPDPTRACALGAVNLVNMLRRLSRNTMPVQAMIPAAMTLMLHALDFADRSGILKVDGKVLDAATKMFADFIMQALNVSAAQLQQAAVQAHGVMQNPEHMKAVQAAAKEQQQKMGGQ